MMCQLIAKIYSHTHAKPAVLIQFLEGKLTSADICFSK